MKRTVLLVTGILFPLVVSCSKWSGSEKSAEAASASQRQAVDAALLEAERNNESLVELKLCERAGNWTVSRRTSRDVGSCLPLACKRIPSGEVESPIGRLPVEKGGPEPLVGEAPVGEPQALLTSASSSDSNDDVPQKSGTNRPGRPFQSGNSNWHCVFQTVVSEPGELAPPGCAVSSDEFSNMTPEEQRRCAAPPPTPTNGACNQMYSPGVVYTANDFKPVFYTSTCEASRLLKSGHVASPPGNCTQNAGTLYHPTNGAPVSFRNGCEQRILIEHGYKTEGPRNVCAADICQ